MGEAESAALPETARGYFDRSIEIGWRLVAQDPEDVHAAGGLAWANVRLGDVWRREGILEAAGEAYEEAVAILAPLVDAGCTQCADETRILGMAEVAACVVRVGVPEMPDRCAAGLTRLARLVAASPGMAPARHDFESALEDVRATLAAVPPEAAARTRERIAAVARTVPQTPELATLLSL